MEIYAIRDLGDREGSHVVDRLMATIPVMVARGRDVLDRNANTQDAFLSVIFRQGIEPGQLVEVHDSLFGVSWRGIVTQVEHRFGDTTSETRLGVVKMSDG